MLKLVTFKDDDIECEVPEFLVGTIRQMEEAWYKLDNGIPYTQWDLDYMDLQSDINVAEFVIGRELADYFREKYLRMEPYWKE